MKQIFIDLKQKGAALIFQTQLEVLKAIFPYEWREVGGKGGVPLYLYTIIWAIHTDTHAHAMSFYLSNLIAIHLLAHL